jgi:hypothetical protein
MNSTRPGPGDLVIYERSQRTGTDVGLGCKVSRAPAGCVCVRACVLSGLTGRSARARGSPIDLPASCERTGRDGASWTRVKSHHASGNVIIDKA